MNIFRKSFFVQIYKCLEHAEKKGEEKRIRNEDLTACHRCPIFYRPPCTWNMMLTLKAIYMEHDVNTKSYIHGT
jgi:hypothetical protein